MSRFFFEIRAKRFINRSVSKHYHFECLPPRHEPHAARCALARRARRIGVRPRAIASWPTALCSTWTLHTLTCRRATRGTPRGLFFQKKKGKRKKTFFFEFPLTTRLLSRSITTDTSPSKEAYKSALAASLGTNVDARILSFR